MNFASTRPLPFFGLVIVGASLLFACQRSATDTGSKPLQAPSQVKASDGNLSIDGLRKQIEAGIQSEGKVNVAWVLSRLPTEFRQNYVLMEATRSRHIADLAHPRLIMFSADARLLLAVSSHPTDPAREVLEAAELSPSGVWTFREFDLSKGTLSFNDNDVGCTGCHGVSPRPIWASYPKWPGALADHSGKLEPAQFDVVSKLATNGATKDRYAHLEFNLRADIKHMFLPKRQYNYGNVIFNEELGKSVAEGIYLRMKRSPKFERLGSALLLGSECRSLSAPSKSLKTALSKSPEFKALLSELGITPMDLAVQLVATEPVPADGQLGQWNASNAPLKDFVLLLALLDLYDFDSRVAQVFSAEANTIATYRKYGWDLRGAERQEATTQYDYYNFRPSERIIDKVLGDAKSSPARMKFCEILATKVEAVE